MSEQLPGEQWERYMSFHRGDHDPNRAEMIPEPTTYLPYRIATQINEHVVKECFMNDYYMGRAEKDDIAYHYTMDLIDHNAVDDHTIAFNGLFLWRRIYNGGQGQFSEDMRYDA